jgi:hypothetical protein
MSGVWKRSQVEAVRHRQMKGAATDTFGLPPSRHTLCPGCREDTGIQSARRKPSCSVTRRRFSSGCKAHPAIAPAGSSRGRHGMGAPTSRWSANSIPGLAPIELAPREITRVFLNLTASMPPPVGSASAPVELPGQPCGWRPAIWARRSKCRCATTAPSSRPRPQRSPGPSSRRPLHNASRSYARRRQRSRGSGGGR